MMSQIEYDDIILALWIHIYDCETLLELRTCGNIAYVL